MLLIDGVKYELWTPNTEEEFENIVKEHTQEIFGEQSIYIDRKQKLKSLSGIGSIPDGYVILLGSIPQWHIVEVELSSHPLHDHIISQVGRFISGINNPNIQRAIVNAIDEEIARNDFLKLRLRKAIEPTEIHRFLSDLISKQPTLTIVIEKNTDELREALSTLRYPEIKVVEFQTFVREQVGLSVHAHLFEPLFQIPTPSASIIMPAMTTLASVVKRGEGRVTAKYLIDANILKVGQILYGWHHNTKYEGKVLNDGSIELLHTGEKFPSLNAAVHHVKGSAEDAWRWWLTTRENGSECVLDELRKEFRSTHPSNQ